MNRKERLAAGPADWITTRLPTNRPAPITPPRAIMVICRSFNPWRSPLETVDVPITSRSLELEHPPVYHNHVARGWGIIHILSARCSSGKLVIDHAESA